MLRIRKVLFPTDFSRCSEQALGQALFFAKQYGAELHLLHAVVLHQDDPADPGHRFPASEELYQRLLEVAGTAMAALVDRHRRPELSVRQFRERGFSPGEVILDHASDHDIDLIVMGTHGRRGPARFFFGSVAAEVVRFASCPVLSSRELEEPQPVAAIRRILVPVDFSPHSRVALGHARHLAAAYGAIIQILHVIDLPPYPYFYLPLAGVEEPRRMSELEKKAGEALERLPGEAPGPEVRCEKYVVSGRPASRIATFAAEYESDLVVLATHGLSGIERLLLGSTSEEVVRSVPVPVFLVKSHGKSLLPRGKKAADS